MRKKIAADKWKHFWVGFPLGIVLQVLCYHYFTLPLTAIIVSAIILIIICYGFELFSHFTKLGHYDLMDAFAGILGGAIGICLVVMLKILLIL